MGHTGRYIPNRLRKFRRSRREKQQTTANILGVQRTLLSKWERGVQWPSQEHLMAICRHFGTILQLLYPEMDEIALKKISENRKKYLHYDETTEEEK